MNNNFVFSLIKSTTSKMLTLLVTKTNRGISASYQQSSMMPCCTDNHAFIKHSSSALDESCLSSVIGRHSA